MRTWGEEEEGVQELERGRGGGVLSDQLNICGRVKTQRTVSPTLTATDTTVPGMGDLRNGDMSSCITQRGSSRHPSSYYEQDKVERSRVRNYSSLFAFSIKTGLLQFYLPLLSLACTSCTRTVLSCALVACTKTTRKMIYKNLKMIYNQEKNTKL